LERALLVFVINIDIGYKGGQIAPQGKILMGLFGNLDIFGVIWLIFNNAEFRLWRCEAQKQK